MKKHFCVYLFLQRHEGDGLSLHVSDAFNSGERREELGRRKEGERERERERESREGARCIVSVVDPKIQSFR